MRQQTCLQPRVHPARPHAGRHPRRLTEAPLRTPPSNCLNPHPSLSALRRRSFQIAPVLFSTALSSFSRGRRPGCCAACPPPYLPLHPQGAIHVVLNCVLDIRDCTPCLERYHGMPLHCTLCTSTEVFAFPSLVFAFTEIYPRL
jgi:hypothetical protein